MGRFGVILSIISIGILCWYGETRNLDRAKTDIKKRDIEDLVTGADNNNQPNRRVKLASYTEDLDKDIINFFNIITLTSDTCLTFKLEKYNGTIWKETPSNVAGCGISETDVGKGEPAQNASVEAGKRIVGGSEPEKGTWPWMVSLIRKDGNQHFCGASLINPYWVLTAAHCFVQTKEKKLLNNFCSAKIEMVFGEHDRQEIEAWEKRLPVEHVIAHEDFDPDLVNFGNDIALVKLSEPVTTESSYITPVCLNTSPPKFTKPPTCWISGWGSTKGVNKGTSNKLLHVEVPIRPYFECLGVMEHDICVGEQGGGISGCSGDSGGPLQCLHEDVFYQYGVASWVNSDSCDSLTAYADVNYYQNWIASVIKNYS